MDVLPVNMVATRRKCDCGRYFTTVLQNPLLQCFTCNKKAVALIDVKKGKSESWPEGLALRPDCEKKEKGEVEVLRNQQLQEMELGTNSIFNQASSDDGPLPDMA